MKNRRVETGLSRAEAEKEMEKLSETHGDTRGAARQASRLYERQIYFSAKIIGGTTLMEL
jgi:hypothetical protein